MIAELASFAKEWLHRELVRAGLAGTLAPRLVNPRTQGWLAGFVEALGQAHQLDAAQQYELEARIYIALFEGSPMGEQLGLEALAMSKRMHSLPGARAMLPDWEEFHRQGAEGGAHFAGLLRSLSAFGDTLRLTSRRAGRRRGRCPSSR